MLHFLMLFGLTALFGGLAIAPTAQAQEKQSNNIVERQPAPKRASYNDNDYEITLSANETNSYRFNNLVNYLDDLTSVDDVISSFNYNDSDYTVFHADEDGSWAFSDSVGNYIYLIWDADTYNGANSTDYYSFQFAYYDDTSNSYADFSTTLIISCANGTDYQSVKSAIALDIQANNDDMPAVLSDFITILISGINSLASGIAGGIVTMAKALFLEVSAQGAVTGLSVFGGIVAIFAGLALAIAITTKVYLWVTSLGN